MSLVWQIVRKDLWRQRWLLLIWVLSGLVMGLTGVAQAVTLHGRTSSGAYFRNEPLGFMALMVFGLGVFFLAALPVLEDSLHDPSAAWRTRPISFSRLLAAKCLFIVGVIAVLPVVGLAGLSVLQPMRIPLQPVHYLVAAEVLLAFGMLSGGAAACSRTHFQCLPALPIGWFLFVVWFGGAMRMDFRYGAQASSGAVVTISLLASAAATAAMFNQYLTRRTVATVMLLGFAGLGPVAISVYWRLMPFS